MVLAPTSIFIVKDITANKEYLSIQDVIMQFKLSFSKSVQHYLTTLPYNNTVLLDRNS